MANIIRGYWKCPYCDTVDIDGLVDVCPNCGRRKPDDTKYYMNTGEDGTALAEDILTKEQLAEAGISEEECDGIHKEWVCDYCDSLNNWADACCASCGSSRRDATKEYGQRQISSYDSPNLHDSEFDDAEFEEEVTLIADQIFDDVPSPPFSSDADAEPWFVTFVRRIHQHSNTASAIMVIFTIIAVLAYLLWPISEVQKVSGFSWERTIVIEEERAVQENDWSVPAGGRINYTMQEIHHYQDVLDHYETVTVTKSRQVLDHYAKTYSDNGNGTFTEHSSPVYKTEYYTDTEQRPVYVQEPVYRTKYYYEIERWFPVRELRASGNDQNPYWNLDYTLAENERDIDRSETYYIYYIDDDLETSKIRADYLKWVGTDCGDQVIVVTSRIGINYRVKSIEKGG